PGFVQGREVVRTGVAAVADPPVRDGADRAAVGGRVEVPEPVVERRRTRFVQPVLAGRVGREDLPGAVEAVDPTEVLAAAGEDGGTVRGRRVGVHQQPAGDHERGSGERDRHSSDGFHQMFLSVATARGLATWGTLNRRGPPTPRHRRPSRRCPGVNAEIHETGPNRPAWTADQNTLARWLLAVTPENTGDRR